MSELELTMFYTDEDLREMDANCILPDHKTYPCTVTVGEMKDFIALIREHQRID